MHALIETPADPIGRQFIPDPAELIRFECSPHYARIRELLDDPDITGSELLADFGPRRPEGVGVIEAPRGTLIHHYRVDENDQVTRANLIVSTTHNNQAMNQK